MNWQQFWNDLGTSADANRQVGRMTEDPVMLDRVALRIVQLLDLKQTDTLLDVCCGNGLITERLKRYTEQVTGVDFSERLLTHARSRNSAVHYVLGDVLAPDFLPANMQFDKICLNFSFQYFDAPNAGYTVLQNLSKHLKPGGKILLTDIPEWERRFNYYNGPRRVMQWVVQTLKGRQDMGKFWSEATLERLSRMAGCNGQRIAQPPDWPYAHYRMDYLLTK